MKRSVITLKKPSRKTVVDAAIPFLLLLLSFLFSSIWILLMGKNPLAAYMALLDEHHQEVRAHLLCIVCHYCVHER